MIISILVAVFLGAMLSTYMIRETDNCREEEWIEKNK